VVWEVVGIDRAYQFEDAVRNDLPAAVAATEAISAPDATPLTAADGGTLRDLASWISDRLEGARTRLTSVVEKRADDALELLRKVVVLWSHVSRRLG
jgi:hypothetical protein